MNNSIETYTGEVHRVVLVYITLEPAKLFVDLSALQTKVLVVLVVIVLSLPNDARSYNLSTSYSYFTLVTIYGRWGFS